MMVAIMLEQKLDTIEEAVDKWSKGDKLKGFRRKEKALRIEFWGLIVFYFSTNNIELMALDKKFDITFYIL
jgi:hypothetical protein